MKCIQGIIWTSDHILMLAGNNLPHFSSSSYKRQSFDSFCSGKRSPLELHRFLQIIDFPHKCIHPTVFQSIHT